MGRISKSEESSFLDVVETPLDPVVVSRLEAEARSQFEAELQEEKRKIAWKPQAFFMIRTPVYKGRTGVSVGEQRLEVESSAYERMERASYQLSVADWEARVRASFESSLSTWKKGLHDTVYTWEVPTIAPAPTPSKTAYKPQFLPRFARESIIRQEQEQYEGKIAQYEKQQGFTPSVVLGMSTQQAQALVNPKEPQTIPWDIRGTRDTQRPYVPIAWTTDPVTGIDILNVAPQRTDVSGRAYGWRWEDIYNIVNYGLVVGGATKVVFSSDWYRFSHLAKGISKIKLAVKSEVPLWKITEPFTKRLARGEMAIPTFEKLGLPELEAESIAWEAMQTPRMGGVMIAREMGTSVGKDPFKYLMKGVTTGWVMKEATFTPLVSQSQITRMGVQPYIPKATSLQIAKEIGLSNFWKAGAIGITTSILRQPQRMKPKTWQPTFEFEKERFRPQTMLETLPSQKQRRKMLPSLIILPRQPQRIFPKQTPSLLPSQKTRLLPFQIPKQVLLPSQKQTQALTFKFPTPTRTLSKTGFPMLPKITLGGGPSQGRPQDLFGRWFRKQHRIKSPAEAASLFGFRMRKGKGGVHL